MLDVAMPQIGLQRARPAFDKLCPRREFRNGHGLGRWTGLGRSLQDLVAFLGELDAVGIDLFLHQQGLGTTTPAGKAMFGMMGVSAEFERAMIQGRVRAGLRRARDEGKQLGRPKIDAETERAILADLRKKERQACA
jgi:DNA invertase Pin-like site-specific DNA recombinase